MVAVKVEITRFVDSRFPGFVECQLVDTSGKTWTFIEKVPVVTLEDLDESSSYPREGEIGCVIVNRYDDGAGREVVRIDTTQPWSIESTDEEAQFDVLAAQLIHPA